MTRLQAVHAIRQLAGEGKIQIEDHAWDQMVARRISYPSLLNALKNLKQAVEQKNGRWRCTGPGLPDGQPVRVIVAIEDNVVVVTTWEVSQP